MRCRHCNVEWENDWEWEYCPACKRNYGGAVYPAKQTPQELADIETLIEIIHQTFAGVMLEDGTTIHEADLEGAYLDEQVRLDSRAKDHETDWRDVPAWKVERFFSALSFFDPKGWRFYLPVFMCWTMKNWRTSDCPTSDWTIWGFEPSGDWSLVRYGVLSDQQGRAVFEFLDFFRKYSSDPSPNRAIEVYWHRYEHVALGGE